jgi:hypothetical protein
MITERDYKIEELAGEFKKKLSNEKRRYEQAQELAKKYKDDGEKKCAMLIEESIKKDVVIKKLKGQLRNKEVKYGRKSDNDLNKSNTSLVNISLIGQSVSTSKFNPTRPFIQEVSTSSENQKSYVGQQKNNGRISQRDGIDTLEEEDPRELTNRNILSEINSPRIFNNASTYRSLSSIKKDPEVFSNLTNPSSGKQQSQSAGLKESEKPVLNINLYGGEGGQENLDTEESRGENKSYKKNKNNPSYAGIGMNDSQSFSNISLELRKKSSSLSGVDFNFNNEKSCLLPGGIEKRKITLIEGDSSKNLQNTIVDDVFDLSGNDNEEVRNGLNFNPSDLSLFKDLQGLMGNAGTSSTSSKLQQSHLNFGEELNGMRKVHSDNKMRLVESRLNQEVTTPQSASDKIYILKRKDCRRSSID